jgi:hypothetical protein
VEVPTTGDRPGVVPDTTVVEGVPPPPPEAATVTSRIPETVASVNVTFVPGFSLPTTAPVGASR